MIALCWIMRRVCCIQLFLSGGERRLMQELIRWHEVREEKVCPIYM